MRRCEINLSKSGKIQFIEKGEQSEWNKKWEKDTLTYAVTKGTEDLPGDSQEKLAMNLAMTTWDIEIPVKLVMVNTTDNPDITIKFAAKDEDPYFKEKPSVLAYAYFPGQGAVSGKIMFNEEYTWSMDGSPKSIINEGGQKISLRTYNLIHVLIHEIGHSLGLKHSEGPGLEKTVMYPYYNRVMDLTDYDKIRIRQIYGIRIFKRWVRYSRILNWLTLRKRRF